MFGWQDYALVANARTTRVTKVPPGVPLCWMLGVLGLTGLTAYFGPLDIGMPEVGETVVVSGAAGSVAGRIAKIKACKVVGIAGAPAKCAWLPGTAGFDSAIDYKNDNVGARLDELCSEGIDIYFDNVGGEILDAALARINYKARVVLCGGISNYNAEKRAPGPSNYYNRARPQELRSSTHGPLAIRAAVDRAAA